MAGGLAGVALFGMASLCAGLSGTTDELIAARVIQGVGAAAMAPQVLATFRVMFSGRERGRAFAVYGAMAGLASAIGLVLGGVLTDANLFGWSWRAVFFVNVPVGLGALAAGVRLIPETRDPVSGRPDLPAAAVLAGSLVAIVYPLLEGRDLGWPAWTWPVMATGVVAMAGLAVREALGQRAPGGQSGETRVAPLLRPRLFRIPAFSAGLALLVAWAAGMQGLLPDLRAVAAGRRALLTAQGRSHGAGVQRRQLRGRACGHAARPAAAPHGSPPRWVTRVTAMSLYGGGRPSQPFVGGGPGSFGTHAGPGRAASHGGGPGRAASHGRRRRAASSS